MGEAVVVFTAEAEAVSTVVAALSAAPTAVVVRMAAIAGVDIAVVMAAMADEEATTEAGARSEACAEVPHRDAIPAHIGAGPGRAEVLVGALRRAGIRLEGQAAVGRWPGIGGWAVIGA